MRDISIIEKLICSDELANMAHMKFDKWLESRSSPEFRERMLVRSKIMAEIRRFFDSQHFLEVQTPSMVKRPGMEPNLSPIRAQVREQGGETREAWLVTSPEYSLKKILAAGYERIFELSRSFRDGEPWDGSHNPEFVMLEWYRVGENYRSLMSDTEQMVESVALAVLSSTKIKYQGHEIDVAAPWSRMTVAEVMKKYAGIDLNRAIHDSAWFRAELRSKGFVVPDDESFDDLFFRVFLRDVEPKLGLDKPVFLYDYPVSMASLARLKSDNLDYAERVEVYCGGLELANGFSELTDAVEQRRRLEEEAEVRHTTNNAPWVIDEDFLLAVAKMPEAAGIAFGVERLVMLLTDAPSIREVLFFPADAVWNDKN